jgi:diadenylate cyclase
MGDLAKMIIEIAVFAIVIYSVLRFLRETRGSGVVRGLALILVVGATSFLILIQVLELSRLQLVFQQLVGVAVLGLIIVFQPEIRRAIVHLGDSPIFGRFFKREVKTLQRLLRSVARLSKDRIGALIAIEREGSLSTLAETGITIDAELNSYLIESIFYPGSALHDGAIIVREDRIVAASCLLPLSQSPEMDKRLGTRHRAGLGLAEETDALSIVVSEETGRISVALGGELNHDLSLEDLEATLEAALGLATGP